MAAVTAGVVATVGAGALAANAASKAGKAGAAGARDAAAAQLQAQELAIAEQRRQFDTALGLSANQRTIGNQALNALGATYGFNPAQGFGADYTPQSGIPEDTGGFRQGVGGLNFTSDEILPLLQQGKSIDEILRLGKLTSSGNRLRKELGLGEEDIAKLRGAYIAPAPGASQRTGTTPQGYSEFGFQGNAFTVPPGVNAGTQARAPGMVANPATSPIPQGGRADYGANPFAPKDIAPGDYSKFFESPDYQFRKQEGLDAVQSSAAARGGLYSGNALRGITDFASNLAAGEYGNYFERQRQLFGDEEARRTNEFNRFETLRGNEFNRLGSLAGIGNTATQQASAAALQQGNNISNILTSTGQGVGNALLNAGNARASGIAGQADAFGQTLNNLGGIAGYFAQQRQNPFGGSSAADVFNQSIARSNALNAGRF